MRKADYQLRHGMFGKAGSVWSRQTDAVTRHIARSVTEVSGSADLLRHVDVVTNYACGSRRVLVDNASFRFVDGDFLVVGRNPKDFTHVATDTNFLALRDDLPDTLLAPTPTPLTTWDAASIAEGAAVAALLPPGEDWYILPIPKNLTPVIIEGSGGAALVAGIDFSTHHGFIATRLPPALTFPSGLVKVTTAYLELPQPNSFVLAAPVGRQCSKFLNAYAKRTQSLVAFQRAASEFCGMFVFPAADVILDRLSIPGAEVYVTAASGALRIDYPHQIIQPGTTMAAGTAISSRLEILTSSVAQPLSPVARALDTGAVVSMDGILPVKGLYAPPQNQTLLVCGETDPISDKPHVRMHLHGNTVALDSLWKRQRAHELATGVFLFDQFFEVGEQSKLVNLSDVIDDYFGEQLSVIMFGGMSASMETLLRQFVSEHKPVGCVMLTARIPD